MSFKNMGQKYGVSKQDMKICKKLRKIYKKNKNVIVPLKSLIKPLKVHLFLSILCIFSMKKIPLCLKTAYKLVITLHLTLIKMHKLINTQIVPAHQTAARNLFCI